MAFSSASAAASDPALEIALFIGAASLLLTLLLSIQILLLRRIQLRRVRRRHDFVRRWRPHMMAAMLGDATTLPPLAAGDGRFFLVLWNELHESVRGEARQGLCRLACASCMDTFARSLLKGGNDSERALAVMTLGRLGKPDDYVAIREIAAGETGPYLSLIAARALIWMDPVRGAGDILPLIIARTEWPLSRVLAILREAGADAVSAPLEKILQTACETSLRRIVPLMAAAHMDRASPLLVRLLDNVKDPELIAMTLALVNSPAAAPRVRAFLKHTDWRVRVKAAAAMGRIGAWHDIERLVPLLGDHEWWVRYRAAQALVRLPGMNVSDLRLLHERLGAGFARDMLFQAEAEAGLTVAAA